MIFFDTFTKDSFTSAVSSFSTKLKECCGNVFPASYKKKTNGADDGSDQCIAMLNLVSVMQLHEIKEYLEEVESLLIMEVRGDTKDAYLPMLEKLVPSPTKIRPNDVFNRMHNMRLLVSYLALNKLVRLNTMVGSHPKSTNAAKRISSTTMSQFIPPLANDCWISATLKRFDDLNDHIRLPSFKDNLLEFTQTEGFKVDKHNQAFKRLADIIVANGVTDANDITLEVLLSYHNDLMEQYGNNPAAYNIRPALDFLEYAQLITKSDIYKTFLELRAKPQIGEKPEPNKKIFTENSSALEGLVGKNVQGIKQITVPIRDRTTNLDYKYWSSKAGSDSSFYPEELDQNNIWIAAQQDYIRSTSNEAGTIKQKNMRLSFLNNYLFSYLPAYFCTEFSGKFVYPEKPEDLIASLFVQRSNVFEYENRDKITEGFQYPVSLQQFVYDMTSAVHRDDTKNNNSGRDALLIISNFFDYLVSLESSLVGNFKNPLMGRTKERVGNRYVKNTKYVFGLEYWLGLRSFCSEVTNQMLDESQKAIESGENCKSYIIVNKDVNIDGSFPMKIGKVNLKDIPQIKLSKSDAVRYKSGTKDETVYVHDHISWSLMNLGLHSGLRRSNAIWLDDQECFKLYLEDNGGFQQLVVTTDKAKSNCYSVTVSSETVEMLQKVYKIKKMAMESNPNLRGELPYDGHKNSKWGNISPLFRLRNAHNDNSCPHKFSEIINEYEAFLMRNGVDFEPTTLFLPALNYSVNEFIYLNSIGDVNSQLCQILVTYHDNNDDVPFTPITRKTQITPHSLRTMTVSVFAPILGSKVVGKYLTGQSEATVDLYTKALPNSASKDLINEIVRLISGSDSNSMSTVLSVRDTEINQKKFAQELHNSPGQTIDKYNAHSINFEIGANNVHINGLHELRKGNINNIAYYRTHICPTGGKCPQEVIDMVGERNCYACPLTVATNNHLPAISAKIRVLCDDINTINTKLKNFEMLETERKDLERDKANCVLKAGYWEVRKEIIERSSANTDGLYYVSDEGLKLMSLIKAEGASELEMLMLRLEETKGVPALHSEKLKMQASRYRRRIEAQAKGQLGNMSEDLSDMEYLATVVKTKAYLRGLTNEQTMALVSIEQ